MIQAYLLIELHIQSCVDVEISLITNWVLCRWDVQGTICKFNSFKYRLYSINCKVMDLQVMFGFQYIYSLVYLGIALNI